MSPIMPFAFNAVELYVVTVNAKPWTRAKEVCKAVGYGKIKKTADVIKQLCSRENYAQKWQLSKVPTAGTSLEWPFDSRKDDYYLNEEGIRELVFKSEQPKAADFAEHLGINVHKHKYTSKEKDSIEIIMKTFHGEKMERQFKLETTGSTCTNCHRIVIECDEFDHIGRDINYEIFRQKFIEEQLQCTFVRYNPDDKDFDMALVLNKIYRTIIKKAFNIVVDIKSIR